MIDKKPVITVTTDMCLNVDNPEPNVYPPEDKDDLN